MRTIIFFFLFIFLGSDALKAQDKILLLNGAEVDCKILADTGYVIVFEVTKRNGKIKQKTANRGEIFSYTNEGQETIVYELDTLFGENFYSVPEMRSFIAGQYDGRNNFKARHIAVIGVLSCGTIAYLGGDGFITAVAPPLAFTLCQFIGKVKIREKTMTNKNYKYNDFYADGYEPPARTKKLLTSLWSGFAGSALGVGMFFLIK